MAALAVAVVGKNNQPLYMKEFRDPGPAEMSDACSLFGLSTTTEESSSSKLGGFECSSRSQFIVHAALDRFEQLGGKLGYEWRTPAAVTAADGMFVGLLAPIEEMRVYGTSQCTVSN
jgi:hypothetical protein